MGKGYFTWTRRDHPDFGMENQTGGLETKAPKKTRHTLFNPTKGGKKTGPIDLR